MTTTTVRTPQQYVDAEIARHQAALATAPIVEGILTHGRAIAELRRIRRTQHRPRLFVPARLLPIDVERAIDAARYAVLSPEPIEIEHRTPAEQAYRDRLAMQRQLPFVDSPAPATSPLYALTMHSLGITP